MKGAKDRDGLSEKAFHDRGYTSCVKSRQCETPGKALAISRKGCSPYRETPVARGFSDGLPN